MARRGHELLWDSRCVGDVGGSFKHIVRGRASLSHVAFLCSFMYSLAFKVGISSKSTVQCFVIIGTI